LQTILLSPYDYDPRRPDRKAPQVCNLYTMATFVLYGRLRLLTTEIGTILRSETRRKLPWLEKGLALHGTGVYGRRISNTSIVGARREGSSLGRQILQSDRKRRDFQISFMHHLATLRVGHAHIHRQSLDRKRSQPDGLSSSAAVGSQQTQGLNVLCFS
jgi:hypothetical protein